MAEEKISDLSTLGGLSLTDILYVQRADGSIDGIATLAQIKAVLAIVSENKPVVNVGGTSLILDADLHLGRRIRFDQAVPCTLFIPDALGEGFYCEVEQVGVGQVTAEASGGSVTFFDNTESRKTREPNSVMSMFASEENKYHFEGDTTDNKGVKFKVLAEHDFAVSGSAVGVSLDISECRTKNVQVQVSGLENDTSTNFAMIPISLGVDQPIGNYNAIPTGYGLGLDQGAAIMLTGSSHDTKWTVEVLGDNPRKSVSQDYFASRTALGYNNNLPSTYGGGTAFAVTNTGAVYGSSGYPSDIATPAEIDELRFEVFAGLITAGKITIVELY